MSNKLIRVLLTVTLIGGSLGYLMYTSMASDTEFYKHVDEVMTSPQPWYGKRLQLHGYVTDGSILQNKQTLEYRFMLENNGQKVNTAYKGVVPDTFKSGAEVVVTGRLDSGGFHAESMTAKCPSKYDPKTTPGAIGKAAGTTGGSN